MKHHHDLEMAKNIAMPRVGVTYGVHTSEVLNLYSPLCVVQNVEELHAFLVAQVKA
ncbi:HAD family hydrolase [Acinetobacter faecalis]|uniref:HAD family hydrolase n=1 Tax=Acinetobacter faecalis TaxID=2665161 RepID=UPI00387EAFDE